MTLVKDSFQRAGPGLGSNWSPVFPNNAESVASTNGGGGIAILSNSYGPINSSGSDAYAVWKANSFKPDQFAQAQVAALAPFTSVVHITAASQSSGSTTYTYTLTSGAALINPQAITITGMTNAGNNGNFLITGLGSGTFTVVNASGVTEAGSNGTGNSPSDSNAGLVVRGTLDGKNGYFLIFGTNSFTVGNYNGVTHDIELWKFVNGVGTQLLSSGTLGTSISLNDVFTLLVVGTKLSVFQNNALIGSATDSSLSSGSPGIWTWSVNGPNEFNWGSWTNSGVMGAVPGNNAQQNTNWVGGDFNNTYTQLASDPFTEGTSLTQVASDGFQRGTQASLGSNWFTNSPDSGTGFQLSSNLVETTSNGTHNYAYWSGNGQTFNENQYSEITIKTNAASNFFGPGVRMQSASNHGGTGANGDGYLLQVGTALGSSGSVLILKRVNNSQTVLATYTSVTVNTGDVLRISVSGTSISATKNGVSLGAPATDSSIVSGFPGFWMDTTAAANCQISAWDAGGVGAPSTFSTGLNQNFQSDATAGVFNTVLDAVTSNGYGALWQNAVSWPNDQYSEATITGSSAGSGATGPGVRISTTQDSGYWFAPVSGSLARLIKNVNGTATTLTSISYTFNTGDIFRIEVIGTNIICKINGVVVIVASDSSLSSGNSGIVSLTASGSTSAGSYSTWDGGGIVANNSQVSGTSDFNFAYDSGF